MKIVSILLLPNSNLLFNIISNITNNVAWWFHFYSDCIFMTLYVASITRYPLTREFRQIKWSLGRKNECKSIRLRLSSPKRRPERTRELATNYI